MMATIKEKTMTDANSSNPLVVKIPPDPPPDPDPPDRQNSPSTSGLNKDSSTDKFNNDDSRKLDNIGKLKILHVMDIPLECHYGLIADAFGIYGQIKEIRMSLKEDDLMWESWLLFNKHEDAFNACKNIGKVSICNSNVKCALTDKIPRNLDYYRPAEWVSTNLSKGLTLDRIPKPPMWLVATAKEDKYNYYKLSKHIQKMVGGIKSGDISRFGKGKVLIHTKSKTQSIMLTNINVERDPLLLSIRPHINFSYGRGVILDRDLYEFEEQEILDMSPPSECKVKKIPRTSLIILTFEDENVPSHVVFENERVKVRPFHPKPLQCYNCYKYGHPSNLCRNTKICGNCSASDHGACEAAPKCINCSLNHRPNDKQCEKYKLEEAALAKANIEHTTIGYAKRILDRSPSYARVLRNPSTNTTRASTSAPITGGGAESLVGMAQPAEPVTTPVRVIESPIRVAMLPTQREVPPVVMPSIPRHPSPIKLSQAESLPDLMDQEQGLVTKRVRTPSNSPPHIRKRNDNHQNLKMTKVELHPPTVNIKDGKKSKNKPNISRQASEGSYK